MSPRKEGSNAPPTLSPIRPSLAAHSRLSVRSAASGTLTPSGELTHASPSPANDAHDPFLAIATPLPGPSRRTSHIDLQRAGPSLAVTDDETLAEEDQVAVEGAASLEGARNLLRAQLQRSDTARLSRKKSGRTFSHALVPLSELMTTHSFDR